MIFLGGWNEQRALVVCMIAAGHLLSTSTSACGRKGLHTLGKYDLQANRQEGISEQQAGILAFFSSVSKVVKYVSNLPSLAGMQTTFMLMITFFRLLIKANTRVLH